MDIKEIKEKIAHWQEVEDNGGSPTSARKLAAFKQMLEEAEPIEEPIEEEIIDDEELAEEEE